MEKTRERFGMVRNIVILDRDGKIRGRFKPVPRREKLFQESFLQRLIFGEPELLPTGEIDSEYSNLIPLGREVFVKSGSIDVLFLTREGGICVVETKLIRNPEAHRTVVAQILDYAKDLSSMSFREFCEAVTKVRGEESVSLLFKKIRQKLHEFDEIEMQENIQKSLSHGRFLLLIVGDRIYPEVALLAESIHSAPHLEFNLSLAELRLYRLRDDADAQFLVVPQIVGGTTQMTRAIVKIRYEEKRPDVEVTSAEPDEQLLDKKKLLKMLDIAEKSLFEAILELEESHGFPIHWGSKGFSLNVDVDGKHVALCYGYGPKAVYKTSLWTSFADIRKKVRKGSDIIRSFRDRFKRTNIFRSTGKEMKGTIHEKLTEKQIKELVELLVDLADTIQQHGLT